MAPGTTSIANSISLYGGNPSNSSKNTSDVSVQPTRGQPVPVQVQPVPVQVQPVSVQANRIQPVSVQANRIPPVSVHANRIQPVSVQVQGVPVQVCPNYPDCVVFTYLSLNSYTVNIGTLLND